MQGPSGALADPVGHLASRGEATECSSQDTTLLELHTEAKSTKGSYPKGKKEAKTTRKPPRRGVPLREEFFAKIGWTRCFVSGPADPLYNPLMVWCHVCKCNFSIKTKRTKEILRHHRSERHLRRDQRWRYEHLRTVYPVSGKVQHRLRGRNGKILSKIELARELPKFIRTELIDVGERFTFFEEFIKGTTTALVTPESRSRTQFCLVGDYIQIHGNLMVLRNLWSRVGSFTNHQATFCDFDWGEERFAVSMVS